MGGFVYADLLASPEGAEITALNVQAYGNYDVARFNAIYANGFGTTATPLVWGMLGDEYEDATTFVNAMTVLETITKSHGETTGGAILWELGDTEIDGVAWGQGVRLALLAGQTQVTVSNESVLHHWLNWNHWLNI